jgi:hypothetical protein
MFSKTSENTSGNPNSPYAWRIKAAYFFATPLVLCLSIIRAVFRVDLTLAFGSPGAFHAEKQRLEALSMVGAMAVKYYDDVQFVPAFEEEYAGRDGGYLIPPMHAAFLRAAMAMAKIPEVVEALEKNKVNSSLISKNDNDSRGNA